MADGDRERVGCVVAARRRAQAEQRLHHPADLVLARAPVAADGALDLLRGVGGAGQPDLSRYEHAHPARLPDRERALGVAAEVERLERDRLAAVTVEQLPKAAVQQREAPL